VAGFGTLGTGDFTPTSRETETSFDDTGGDLVAGGGFLLILSGEDAGRIFPLSRSEHVIGRSDDADIRIDQRSVSHAHAKILVLGARHLLVDLGSTNGTFLNEERVVAEGLLKGGDVIRIGEIVMSFLLSTGDPNDLPTIAIEHVPLDGLSARQGPRALGGVPSSRGLQVRDAPEGMSFRDMVGGAVRATRFARRYRRWLVTSAAVGAFTGCVSVRINPPPGAAVFEMRLTPKPSESSGNQTDENAQYFAAAEADWKNPDLVRRTLVATGHPRPTREEVVKARERLRFDGVALSMYRGGYSDRTSDQALGFLRQHLENYVQFEIDKTLKVMRAQVDFLKGQLDRNEAELSETETKLRDFKEIHLDGLPDQARDEITQRATLKARRSALSAEVERATLALDDARRRLTEDDPSLQHRVRSTAPYDSALVEVKRKLAEARAAGFGDGHPDVQRLTRQESELERLSSTALASRAEDPRERVDPTLLSMRDRVADLEVARNGAAKELSRVSKDLAALDRVVQSLPDVEAEYTGLTRSYAGTKALHDKLFERYKASELELELERAVAAARYQVTLPPDLVKRSVKKTLATRAALGTVVGLILAALAIAFTELRRFVRENEF